MSSSFNLGSVAVPAGLLDAAYPVNKTQRGGLTAVIIGAAVLMPIAVMFQAAAPIPTFVLFVACFVVLTMFSLTLIHELGHLAAAWCLRWEILAFGAGPFIVTRSGETTRLTRSHLPVGFVLANPRDTPALRWHNVAFAAAGSFATLLVAVCVYILVWLFAPIPIWGPFGVVFGSLLIVASLFDLIPMQRSGLRNDGAVIRSMLRDGEEERRTLALTRLGFLEQAGPRPRDWDADLVLGATAPEDGTYQEAVGRLYAYYQQVDRGDLDAASASLERAISISSLSSLARVAELSLRTRLLMETAYLAARGGQDLVQCRMVLDRIHEAGAAPALHRLEAAIQIAEGNRDGAIRSANDALELLNQTRPGIEYRERCWITDLLDQVNASSSS